MTVEQKTNVIINNLKSFFGAEAIGSYLFYREGLLDFEDLTDIDVLVDSNSREFLANYMDSLGFTETIKEGKQIGYENRTAQYEKLPQGDFICKGFPLVIEVQVGKVEVLPLHEIIALKYKRGLKRDFEMIEKIVKNALKR